jgi:hypothetical protein
LEDEDLRLAAGVFLHLKTLRIGDREQTQTKITDEGVEAFASSCEFLEEVHLSSLPLLRDSGISVLIQGCTNFRCLDLESLRSLGDEALEAIAHCRNLQELSLKGDFRFSSAGLTVIGRKCGGLIKLVLDLIGMNIDMALKSISHGCHRLREISLKFKSANLRELSRCTSLRSLSVVTEQEDSLDDAVLAISASNHYKEMVVEMTTS